MISEKEFANGFGGFWADCLPFLNPHLVAEFNFSGIVLTSQRHEALKPLKGLGDNSQNDIVAETAFGLFVEALRMKDDVLTLTGDRRALEAVVVSAKQRTQKLRRRGRVQAEEPGPVPLDQAIELATRLEAYFRRHHHGEPVVVQPEFKGCGLLDSCIGDLLASACLYEVKMVDRNLRSADLRQLLIYCALNHKSQQYDIESVSVLNPRRGIQFRFRLEDLVSRVSSMTSAELFHDITEFLSNFDAMHHCS